MRSVDNRLPVKSVGDLVCQPERLGRRLERLLDDSLVVLQIPRDLTARHGDEVDGLTAEMVAVHRAALAGLDEVTLRLLRAQTLDDLERDRADFTRLLGQRDQVGVYAAQAADGGCVELCHRAIAFWFWD